MNAILEVLAAVIIGTGVVFVVRYLVFRLLVSGKLTGNKYARGEDDKIWVKHPGRDWERLEDHENRQKRLRENR